MIDNPVPAGTPARDRKPARSTTRRGTLSRRVILDAVANTVAANGVDAVTMRGVATRLKVDPMALYRHFADKDALLTAFVDDVFAGIEAPAAPGIEGAKELVRQYFQALITHPGLVNIDIDHTASSPHQLLVAERLYRLLLDAGYDVKTAITLFDGLQRFILGSALLYPRRSELGDITEWNRVRALFRGLDPDRYPTLREVNEHVTKRSQEDIFEEWLSWVFDRVDAPTPGDH